MRRLILLALLLPAAALAEPHFVLPPEPVISGPPVRILLTGLPPAARVTVTAVRTSYDGKLLASHADFVVDRRGTVDLATATPLAGSSYAVADPAGIFWSLAPATGTDAAPQGLHAFVHGVEVATAPLPALDARTDLVTVAVPTLPGALVVSPPADGRRHGAIIVLGGSEGGDEFARAMAPRLAAHGYVVLGLPYYSPDYGGPAIAGLPTSFSDIPVDRLTAARAVLAARPDVDPGRIGLYGVSKGAEFALLAAAHFDWLKAVVAVVPSDVVWEGWGKPVPAGTLSSFSWNGKPLPFVPYDDIMAEFSKAMRGETMELRGPHVRGKAKHPDALAAARIRVEDYHGALLVAGGGDDHIWPSLEMARAVAATRTKAGERTVLLSYPAAGHDLSGNGYRSTSDTAGVGGTPAANAAAQGDLWPRTLKFLAANLGR